MPKGHFNILYPGLQLDQIETEKPVDSRVTGLVRGSAIVDNGSGAWRLTAAADAGSAGHPGPMVYWALQDQDSPDAVKAGVLAGMPCSWPMVVETDQYAGTHAVGAWVAADNNGKVTDAVTGNTVIGKVLKAPAQRWLNDRLDPAGTRMGALANVVVFQTLYIPSLAF